MMRSKEGGLHYTINGQDQGVAIDSVPPGVYAVIDLYGVCAQASVLHNSGGQVTRHVTGHVENSLASSQAMESSQASIQLGPSQETVHHKFSQRWIALKMSNFQSIVKPKSSPKSRSQIQVPNPGPKSKSQIQNTKSRGKGLGLGLTL